MSWMVSWRGSTARSPQTAPRRCPHVGHPYLAAGSSGYSTRSFGERQSQHDSSQGARPTAGGTPSGALRHQASRGGGLGWGRLPSPSVLRWLSSLRYLGLAPSHFRRRGGYARWSACLRLQPGLEDVVAGLEGQVRLRRADLLGLWSASRGSTGWMFLSGCDTVWQPIGRSCGLPRGSHAGLRLDDPMPAGSASAATLSTPT